LKGNNDMQKIINIWYQGYLEVDALPEYQNLLTKHVKTLKNNNVEVFIHGMPKDFFYGTSPAEVTRYASSSMIFSNQILLNAMQAEEEKFDGLILGTIQNLALQETKSLIDIPVVGYGEAAMSYANKKGGKFAVLAFNPNLLELIDLQIKNSDFKKNAAPSILINLEYNDILHAFRDPAKLIKEFQKSVIQAKKQDVKIIIPGQMVLAELLWINKIDRLEGIEIIDAMKTSIEAIVDKIKNKTNLESGFWISTPPKSLKKIIKDKLQDHK
tara:strand:- start:6813 stop:7622 length:810 start_codon:yes stop_codon:yes gene_type:complete